MSSLFAPAEPLTLFLAKVLGGFLIARSLPALRDPEHTRKMFETYTESRGLSYVAALLTFMIGAAIVHSHTLWTHPLAILVTLTGWAAMAEGLLLAAYPSISRLRAQRASTSRLPASLSVLAGLFLVLLGFLITPETASP